MSLHDLYAEVKAVTAITKLCIVGQWSESLEENDKATLNVAMEDSELSSKDLFLLLRRAGGEFGLTAVREHRRGDCVCLQQMITTKL